jgi:DNA processing protein
LSKGTNKLIKDGAKLTEDAEDVLSEFEYLIPRTSQKSGAGAGETSGTKPALKLTEMEEKVMAHISNEEVAIDEIIRASGLTSATVSATLLGLEMKRFIRQLPGKTFVRTIAD